MIYTNYCTFTITHRIERHSLPGMALFHNSLFFTFYPEVKCVQGLHLWRDSTSVVNDELFKGYRGGNSGRKINEIAAGLACFAFLMM